MANQSGSDTFSKLNGSTASDAKSKSVHADNQLERLSHEVGERAGAMASQIADTSTQYVKSSRDYVKENPVKGVMIAAAAGIVTGSILTMLMRRAPATK